jgi:hypothetical protein
VLPVSAAHSGLQEVSAQLAERLPAPAVPWLSFPLDGDPVTALAERLIAWLGAPEDVRSATRAALVETARARFSWEGVADSVIAAARGELHRVARP